jgi:hypothetical protein
MLDMKTEEISRQKEVSERKINEIETNSKNKNTEIY